MREHGLDDDDYGHGITSEIRIAPGEPTVARRRAQLTVISGVDVGLKIALGSGPTAIGRGPGLAVPLRDPLVSRAHARVLVEAKGFVVEDTGSRYGTFLNGDRIVRAALSSGDRIVLGGTALLFDYRDAEADRALEREQLEMVGRLGAGLVHDMNNLLGISLLSAEGLRRALTDGSPGAHEEALSCIEAIVTATRRGQDLTSHLLRLARRQPIEMEELDLSALTTEAIDLARRTIPRGVEIVSSVTDGLRVVGNRAELHRIVINLLLNARDAMPDRGRLIVTLRPTMDTLEPERDPAHPAAKSAMVRLTVRDSGVGMDEETRARIFQPLFTTKAGGKGTGLGLASVAQVAAAHGGRVVCESTKGAGTSMEIILPRAASDAPTSMPTRMPPAPATSE